jgi:diguanylate cyclase (GGDEF)-like protein
MTRHLYHLEDMSAEDSAQVVRQELSSFRRTLRSIEWLLPFIVMLYFFVSDNFFASDPILSERPPLQFAIGAYVVFLGCMQLIRWSDKYTWAIISAQIWGMILFVTLILWQTGGIWSPLLCLYLFPIIISAVALPENSTPKFLVVMVFCFSLALPGEGRSVYTPREQISTLLLIIAFWVVPYIASLLSTSMLKARRQIQELSGTDYLSGLQNMRTFLPLARKEFERSVRYGHPFSILMIDADNLKPVNERYGHIYGSTIIRQIGEAIARNIRSSDIAARYGGDEFVVLLHETSPPSALHAAERIRMDVERIACTVPGGIQSITISTGVAGFPEHGEQVEDIISQADKALFIGKSQGKNRCTVAGPTSETDSAQDMTNPTV